MLAIQNERIRRTWEFRGFSDNVLRYGSNGAHYVASIWVRCRLHNDDLMNIVFGSDRVTLDELPRPV